jgi:hypothetical protein
MTTADVLWPGVQQLVAFGWSPGVVLLLSGSCRFRARALSATELNRAPSLVAAGRRTGTSLRSAAHAVQLSRGAPLVGQWHFPCALRRTLDITAGVGYTRWTKEGESRCPRRRLVEAGPAKEGTDVAALRD